MWSEGGSPKELKRGAGDGNLASRAMGKECEHHRRRVSDEDTTVRAGRGQAPGGK